MTLAVCSWSLQPESPRDLAAKLDGCGVPAVQLALDPLRTGEWDESESVRTLQDAGVGIVSGMMAMAGEDYSTLDSIRRTGGVAPDEHWETNLRAASCNAALAQRLGVGLVTFHAGFLPHRRGDALRTKLLDRLRRVTAEFAERGVRVGFETGQESAETLLDVLDELSLGNAVGVNFDPANMILYGMGDPIESLHSLLPHIVQLHIKDALPTDTPGQWGSEVPAGAGAVDWARFFEIANGSEHPLDCCIEREAGGSRTDDIRRAAELVRELS